MRILPYPREPLASFLSTYLPVKKENKGNLDDAITSENRGDWPIVMQVN